MKKSRNYHLKHADLRLLRLVCFPISVLTFATAVLRSALLQTVLIQIRANKLLDLIIIQTVNHSDGIPDLTDKMQLLILYY